MHVLLTTATSWVFWIVALLTTIVTFLGNWTLYRSLYFTGTALMPWGQAAVFALGFIVAVVAGQRQRDRSVLCFVKVGAVVASVLGLGAIAIIFALSGSCSGNLHTARTLTAVLTWVRVLIWTGFLVSVGLSISRTPSMSCPAAKRRMGPGDY